MTYYFGYDNFKMQEQDKGVNEMQKLRLRKGIKLIIGLIIIIGIILLNFKISSDAVNTCISNGQDANVCNELWK